MSVAVNMGKMAPCIYLLILSLCFSGQLEASPKLPSYMNHLLGVVLGEQGWLGRNLSTFVCLIVHN